jgi:hypothetical protein
MDFFQIVTREKRGGVLEAFPDFIVGRTTDLMVRAKAFYAIWDEEEGLWSTDEYDVQRIVDSELKKFHEANKHIGEVKYMRNFGSNQQTTFRKYMSQIGDNSHQLDEKLTFKSTPVTKKDYVSKRLPYDLTPGDISAWDKMIGTLYKPTEREKIEWFFGAIISGDSVRLQKFIVLHGPPGAGKGTIIDIAMDLFQGYLTTFDAKALGTGRNQFAAAAFAGNPLIAIQHDGDLSRVEDNTTLNSIVSHEWMKIDEKYKPAFDARILAVLLMGTNKPVKITDAQSGLIRRLIDVHPSGNKLTPAEYHPLKEKIKFELGAIAHHCLQVYKNTGGFNKYNNYQPLEMMFKTNAFFNFIEAYYDVFEKQDGVAAQQAWKLYKEYTEEANLDRMKLYAFKSELSNYFETYHDRIQLDGVMVRSYYQGFKAEPFMQPVDGDVKNLTLRVEETTSLFDLEFADCPAQYATAAGAPRQRWENVKTTLAEIDTAQEHYVSGLPENLIVADFDLRNDDGNKSLELNLEAATNWPATYAELSKSGQGVHLHYFYDGDVKQLEREFLPGIEIKVFSGNSALRRRLSLCNNVPIATIAGGLPLKEKKRVLDPGTMKNEKALRALIVRNLNKEIHPGTKPSLDFIKHILDEAYEDGMKFDVTDMRQRIITFANNSTNRPLECLKIVQSMRWKSEEDISPDEIPVADERLVFYDIEVYPNLLMICWKFEEEEPSAKSVTVMINPKPHEVQALFKLKLVGFNVRNYDNHIMWAAAMGFSNEQIYELSKNIIAGSVGAKFGAAYNLSHTDIYDYSTDKMSLKKWQIKLGLPHKEMDLPWDQPVPTDRLKDVEEYCINDVLSEEHVHQHLQGDYKARLILADLSGLTPNDTTAKHTAAIVFGKDKNPQREFRYTKLDKEFPGYVFEGGKSTYRGEEVGEGGLVRGKTGLWRDVGLFDIASMHPTSIGQLNLFGDYTPRYMAIVHAQIELKHMAYALEHGLAVDYGIFESLLDGKFMPYINDIRKLAETDRPAAAKAAKQVRYGLKIAMNIVYGLTSAKFDNPFKDFRNADNIVAKRGALFMIDLMHYIEDELGFTVVHIKTDSVKIAGATEECIQAVMNFGEKYGYTFEHEATYAKFALFNDAVYVAKKDECITNCWTATGTQFIPEANPYVFKKLFGYPDDIGFQDYCVTRSVQQGAIYLDFGIHNADVETGESDADMGYIDSAVYSVKYVEKMKKKAEKSPTADRDLAVAEAAKAFDEANNAYGEALKKLVHVGKTGSFVPVLPGYGGGQLWRIKDGKHYAINDTKGYLWVSSDIAMDLPDDAIDYSFFDRRVEVAKADIQQFIDDPNKAAGFHSVEEFLS